MDGLTTASSLTAARERFGANADGYGGAAAAEAEALNSEAWLEKEEIHSPKS